MEEKVTRLRYWRNIKVLSIRELAEKANVDPMTISKIENRGTTPTKRVVQKLAKALEIEPKDLYKEGVDWGNLGKNLPATAVISGTGRESTALGVSAPLAVLP